MTTKLATGEIAAGNITSNYITVPEGFSKGGHIVEAQKLEEKLPTDKLYAMELSGVHVRKRLRLTWLDGRQREFVFADVYRITHNKLGTVKITGTERLHGPEYSQTFPANAEVEIL